MKVFGSLRMYILFLVCLGATVVRISRYWMAGAGIDFRCYYDVALALARGVDPYDAANMTIQHVGFDVPSVLPFQAFVMVPWTWLPLKIATLIFTSMQFGIAIGVFVFLWHKFIPLSKRRARSAPEVGRMSWGALLFLNTSPMTTAMYLGQVSITVSGLLLVALYHKNWLVRGCCLAIGTALKLSLTPLFGLLLLVRGDWKACTVATLILATLMVLPAIYGHSLESLYSGFVHAHQLMGDNFNTYSGINGSNLMSAGYFKNEIFNLILKAVAFVCMLVVVLKQQKAKTVDGLTLFGVMSITMLVVYHRSYDAIILMGLLVVILASAWQNRSWYNVSFCTLLLGYLVLPLKWACEFAVPLGELLEGNSFIWMTRTLFYPKAMFPFPALVMLILFVYGMYLWAVSNRLVHSTARWVPLTVEQSQPTPTKPLPVETAHL